MRLDTQSSTGGGAATVADGADVALGAKADAAVIDPTAAATVIALLKGNIKELIPSSTGSQGSKNVAVAGTPLQLTAGSTPCTSVILTARVGNTKEIAYGFSNAVRATAGAEVGACLQPGDSVALKWSDLTSIWIDAQVGGEGVSFTYTTN